MKATVQHLSRSVADVCVCKYACVFVYAYTCVYEIFSKVGSLVDVLKKITAAFTFENFGGERCATPQ